MTRWRFLNSMQHKAPVKACDPATFDRKSKQKGIGSPEARQWWWTGVPTRSVLQPSCQLGLRRNYEMRPTWAWAL